MLVIDSKIRILSLILILSTISIIYNTTIIYLTVVINLFILIFFPLRRVQTVLILLRLSSTLLIRLSFIFNIINIKIHIQIIRNKLIFILIFFNFTKIKSLKFLHSLQILVIIFLVILFFYILFTVDLFLQSWKQNIVLSW